MQRIIIHWTGGGGMPSATDLKHYHYIIDAAGKVHSGRFPVEANQPPLRKGAYAAHTRNANGGAIGVALAAMAGAVERPFDPGTAPLNMVQLEAMAHLCAGLAARYRLPVTPQTVLTHAEVQPVLGITQRGKWDITWLPGMTSPAAPQIAGERIRAMIRAAIPPDPKASAKLPRGSEPWAAALLWLSAMLRRIFTKNGSRSQ